MEAPGVGREHMNKFAHAGCVCVVEPSQSYCSEYCARESSADTSNELPGKSHGGACECGHPDCEHKH
jgi:hypothetical protein